MQHATLSSLSSPPSPPTDKSHTSPKHRRAVVVGAGPVGCLAALSLANAGWNVELYEGRPDIRLASSKTTVSQRSINLAISSRGIAALHAVDPSMATRFLESAIPMRGRMIHHQTGKLESQLYDPHGQCINSIERGILNEELLDRATNHPAIRVFFQHKLTTADFDERTALFASTGDEDRKQVQTSFDLCVGADGSYSNVRRQMMRVVKMNYQQEYITHEYLELRMPPGPIVNGRPTFLIDPNHLHIWPRHSFMLIALPNKDGSFTCTLFAPTADLDSVIRTPDVIVGWFRRHFPDALALIGEATIVRDFQNKPRSALIAIKAKPYHYKDRAVIIGDAAHSMVPFYGQGLNCGLEDVRILQTIISTRGIVGVDASRSSRDVDERLQAALEEYSTTRHDDLLAISDLAMNNYTEMRHDVTTPIYRLHKAVDTLLASLTPPVGFASLAPTLSHVPYPSEPPRGWIPLYTMVTFRPDVSYGLARRRAHWQSRCLRIAGWTVVGIVGSLGAWLVRRYSTPLRSWVDACWRP